MNGRCHNATDRILHYGTGADDDVLLLRTRLSADYRFSEQAHTFVEFQDARYGLSHLALSRFFAGDFVRNTPGNGQNANWAFAQLTYNF